MAATTTSPSADLIQERLTSGLYSALPQKMRGFRTTALCNISYNEDFFANYEDENSNVSFINRNGGEFTTIICGEICPESQGTAISAKGAFNAGISTNVS
jgi:hypothetical protein